MNTKTSLLTMLVLCGALLSGCTVTTGSSSRAIRVADERQNVSAERRVRLLQEELRLAEKRADFEKQKREFAEERLKKLQERPAKPEPSDKESRRGS